MIPNHKLPARVTIMVPSALAVTVPNTYAPHNTVTAVALQQSFKSRSIGFLVLSYLFSGGKLSKRVATRIASQSVALLLRNPRHCVAYSSGLAFPFYFPQMRRYGLA